MFLLLRFLRLILFCLLPGGRVVVFLYSPLLVGHRVHLSSFSRQISGTNEPSDMLEHALVVPEGIDEFTLAHLGTSFDADFLSALLQVLL
jgi:hypothetical protein